MASNNYNKIFLILGNCLYRDYSNHIDNQTLIFMKEDNSLCNHFKYHKHKIILFLSSMRNFRDEIIDNDHDIKYIEFEKSSNSYEDELLITMENNNISKIITYDIEDKFFRKRIIDFCKKNNFDIEYINSPGFLTSNDRFQEYIDKTKNPFFMNNFYMYQRKYLEILISKDKSPVGGRWSFDDENRKKLPRKIDIPNLPEIKINTNTKNVINLVDRHFENNPGDSSNFYLPTKRNDALLWMKDFFDNKLDSFGPYEDAISSKEEFVFHSVLSPLINIGLITPNELIDQAIKKYGNGDAKIQSVEGFIRQIIGWREFIRGMYNTKDFKKNYFKHKNKLNEKWYKGNTGLDPLDKCIKNVIKNAYLHHIERLMIVGNIMLMCRIDPDEVNKWFMEMFVDSSDWVMEPNVYGMSQFADGGVFATKPYIAGSNYIIKMSDYSKGSDWCEIMDGLYWKFIDDNRDLFSSNYRMSMMVKLLDKMDNTKKNRIFKKADNFIKEVTI